MGNEMYTLRRYTVYSRYGRMEYGRMERKPIQMSIVRKKKDMDHIVHGRQ